METEPDFQSQDPNGQPPAADDDGPSLFSRLAGDTPPLRTGPQEEGLSLHTIREAVAALTPEEEPEAEDPLLPRQPRSLAEVGLSRAFVTDLTLKIIHYAGTPTLSQIVRRLGIAQSIVQQLLTALTEERLCQVISQSDVYTGNYRYRLSEKGEQRALQALERSRYAGAVPVTVEQYTEAVRRIQAHRQPPSRAVIKECLNELVLAQEVADAVARALYSGKVTLLYGPSGNGKTTILETFARKVDGVALVPYAIYAYGQVIRVFDPSVHQPVGDLEAINVRRDESKMDRRWVLVRRPTVILGSEVGPESLDLAYDPTSHFYQAPPHIKAQGGILLVDDFGRQKVEPRELLTRWLIPLERGWDTLTLATGEKVTVPFDVQPLFATNLPIRQLADEALLRRILYKVQIPPPRPQEFAEILRRLCRERRVLVAEGAIDVVVQRVYSDPTLRPKAALARDIVSMIIESASYEGRDPVLDPATFEQVRRMFISEGAEE